MLINDDIFINNTKTCNSHCKEITSDIKGYLEISKEDKDFILAVISLRNYRSFDDFLMAIGSRRRGEYRRAIREGYYTKILNTEERNERRNELFAINTSTDERQGKMSEEYSQYPPKDVEY